MSPHSAEIAYLEELINDFPADVAPEDASGALKMITARYQIIEQNYHSLPPVKNADHLSEASRIFALKSRVSALHEYLYNGILGNAGEFRKSSDPGNGYIGFGGPRHQRQRPQFRGVTPSKISNELDKALIHLDYETNHPIGSALRFYQHFVYIHPLYDANGRIGRVMVSTFLHRFDFYVRWGDFDGSNNSKFIGKLNECHKRMDSGFQFKTYFGYLLDFFREHVVSVDELSDF